MPWVSGGNITGTTGRKLRIEGININLSQDTVHSLTGTIMYRTHVQDIGWTGWKTLGQYSGTSGRAKQVEATYRELWMVRLGFKWADIRLNWY